MPRSTVLLVNPSKPAAKSAAASVRELVQAHGDIEPEVCEIEFDESFDPVAYVITHNLHRSAFDNQPASHDRRQAGDAEEWTASCIK